MDYSQLIGYMVQGVFIAIGTVVGTYISNRLVIDHIGRLERVIKRRVGRV